MSRLYFLTATAAAELSGSELAWLNHLAEGPAMAAWDLDGGISGGYDHAAALLELVPEVPDGPHGANYLHEYLRKAQAERDHNHLLLAGRAAGGPWPVTCYEAQRQFVESLRCALRVGGFPLHVAGTELHSRDVMYNTALVAGSDQIRLAAKLGGWAEAHTWVEGPDRAWLAEVMAEGLRTGVYRTGMWYASTPDGPRDQYADQGWGQVIDLLRAGDDGPVVASYSGGDDFPNPAIAEWTAPPMPPGWAPRWARTEDGATEWERDYVAAGRVADYYSRYTRNLWYSLPDEQRWSTGVAGLRATRPWARLAPDTLATVAFGPAVTVYDLLAPDRDERVRAAVNAEPAAGDPQPA